MAIVKTAISLDAALFEQVERLAHNLNVPRSRLFAMALEDFIHKYENQQLLEAINAVYETEPDAAEEELLQKMRQTHRRLVEGEW